MYRHTLISLSVDKNHAGSARHRILTSLRSSALATALFAASVFAQLPQIASFSSTSPQFGTAVAAVGDIDLDGVEDFVIGDPAANVAFVHSGAPGHALLLTLNGAVGSDSFGYAAAGAGDVDDDGTPDIIVGAPGTNAVFVVGRVRVFSGATGSVIHDLVGTQVADQFGASVDGVGDLDGDGKSEFIVGQPFPSPGRAIVYSGATGQALYTSAPSTSVGGTRFGAAAIGVGDVNLDNIPDFVIGTGAGNGYIRVHSGATGALLQTIVGPGTDSRFGAALADAGDLDADGRNDIVVGVPFSSVGGFRFGRVDVYTAAGSLLRTAQGDLFSGLFGSSVAGGADLDGDGVVDFVAATPFMGVGGIASVRSGVDGSERRLLTAGVGGVRFGTSCAILPDIVGDALPEVIVGAPGATAAVGGAATIWSVCGARSYGAPLGLTMDWVPGPPSDPRQGFVTISGAAGFSSGAFIAGPASASTPFQSIVLAVDPAQISSVVFFGFDAQGGLTVPLDLGDPIFGSAPIFAQVIGIDFATVAVTSASNGLALLPLP